MAVGAGPRPRLADAAGDPGRLADGPGGRVAGEACHGAERGDVDALPVSAHGHRGRAREPMAVGTGPRPGLADAAGGPGRLGEGARGRVAVEARHCVAVSRDGVDALPV